MRKIVQASKQSPLDYTSKLMKITQKLNQQLKARLHFKTYENNTKIEPTTES